MANPRTIWNYEVKKADKIASRLLENNRVKAGWRILLLPFFLLDYFRFKKNLWVTRKNLLFTKQLAFDGARAIFEGSDRSTEIGAIDKKTKNLLDKDKKGFYTEKIRRKQLHEIELLLDHYLGLLNSNKSDYDGMTAVSYQTRGKYLSFINTLYNAEKEVIRAAVTTMRKGSKSGRRQWFKTVKDISRQAWLDEAQRIFPNTQGP
ncbi:MAG: NF038143 family protein [Planctomycetota bacterium]|jgi:hypothetical protein